MEISLADIIRVVEPLEVIGNQSRTVRELIMADVNNQRDDVLMWLNDKNLHKVKSIQAGVVVCSRVESLWVQPACTYLLVRQPRSAFKAILEAFFLPEREVGISDSAIIAPDVEMGAGVFIGAHAVIDAGCRLGDFVSIGPGTHLKRHTVVGNHTDIGSNCTIGGKGLGYEKDGEGHWQHIPHIGNVVIGDHVSIHDHVVINQAVMGSTRIGDHTKIDSHVMVAHGVQVGRNCMICGCVSIAGSTVIGENCWIAPNASIINKIEIGSDVFVGIGAVVIRSVASHRKVFGNPAMVLKLDESTTVLSPL